MTPDSTEGSPSVPGRLPGLILIEGPDGAGKTTLGTKLAEALHGVLYRSRYRFVNNMFAYHTAILRAAIKTSYERPAIIDRLWPSHDIYGRVYRGENWDGGRLLDRVLLAHNAIYIICNDEVDKLNERRHQDGPLRTPELYPQQLRKFTELAMEYDWLIDGNPLKDPQSFPATYSELIQQRGGLIETHPRVFRYRVGDNIEVLVKRIASRFLETEKNLWYYPGRQNAGGNPQYAEWLLVGDQANPNKKVTQKVWWPFYERQHSSAFLSTALDNLLITEPEICLCNALCPQEVGLLSSIHPVEVALDLNPGLRVVALGNKADHFLNVRQIPHTKVPHPSHGRRFSNLATYTKRLAEGLGI